MRAQAARGRCVNISSRTEISAPRSAQPLGIALRYALGIALRHALGIALRHALGSALRQTPGSALGQAVGNAEGTSLVHGSNPELSHARPERRTTHPEQFGGALRTRQHTPALGQRPDDVLPLDFFERRKRSALAAVTTNHTEVSFENRWTVAQDDRAFEDIGQLPHVAWPFIGHQPGHRVGVDPAHPFPHPARKLQGEVRRQQRHVGLALAERR